MTKSSDSDKKNRGNRRAHDKPAGTKYHQWGEVDDQLQDDLIDPVEEVKPKKGRVAKRRDKDVGTMYVAPTEDYLRPVKKRALKETRAEDVESFRAEVEEDEVDPYSIPSYGQTKLTHDDEEMVDLLLMQKEIKEQERRRAAQERAAKKAQEEEAKRQVAEAQEAQPAANKKNARAPKAEKAPKAQTQPAPKKEEDAAAPAHKSGSFLAKIKEAIATGSLSPAKTEEVEQPRLTLGKMRWLARRTQKIVDTLGVDTVIPEVKDRPQVVALAEMLETLLDANSELITLIESFNRANGAQAGEAVAAVAAVVETAQSAKTTKSTKSAKDESAQESASVKVKRARKADADDQAKDDADETEAHERKKTRAEKSKRDKDDKRPDDQASPEPQPESEDADDMIAYWESIARSEDLDAEEPQITEQDDFDDYDEVVSKKKSARLRQDAQAHASVEQADRVASEVVGEESTPQPKPVKRASRKKRATEKVDVEPNEENAEDVAPLEQFGELSLTTPTLKALRLMGYSAPTPIQSGTIPRIQAGVDVLGQARTGTGKTASFMIPIIEGVAQCTRNGSPLALVVVPTRELAVQARDEAERLAYYRDLRIFACYGGKPLGAQVEKLKKGVDILVGTPGRIIDLMGRGALSLDQAHWVVLDEADRMLDIGFRPDVERILRHTPSNRQTLLFSATLPPPVLRLAHAYMQDPEQYDFSQKDVSADTIEQFYLTVDQDRKFDALVRLLEIQQEKDFRQAIIFCRTKRYVDILGRRLGEKFGKVEAIHGDLPQSKRDQIMRNFRAEKAKILVATDIVGRGIDVSSVSHIVNFDVPQYCDDYVHRVGRTGRMGREGVAFTLVTAEEGAELTRIEMRINRLLERIDLPGFEAVAKPTETPVPVERKPVFGKTLRRARRAL
ncbi:MAG: DEAD/DEAH box helicase [Planctomycetia bacterium]|nr:DEAD/DEAH box helicase [Planctomycetia bacterium]